MKSGRLPASSAAPTHAMHGISQRAEHEDGVVRDSLGIVDVAFFASKNWSAGSSNASATRRICASVHGLLPRSLRWPCEKLRSRMRHSSAVCWRLPMPCRLMSSRTRSATASDSDEDVSVTIADSSGERGACGHQGATAGCFAFGGVPRHCKAEPATVENGLKATRPGLARRVMPRVGARRREASGRPAFRIRSLTAGSWRVHRRTLFLRLLVRRCGLR